MMVAASQFDNLSKLIFHFLQDMFEIFKRIDQNGDGNMDYKEFSAVFFSNEMQKSS